MSRKTTFLFAAVAATLLLQLSAGSLGPVAVVVNLIIAMPAAWVHMRCGAFVGGAVVVLITAGLFIMGDAVGASAYLLQFGLASFLLPLLLRRGWAWDAAVGGTLVSVFVTAAVALGGYASYRAVSIGELVAQNLQAEIDRAMALYRQAELPPDQIRELQAIAGRMGEFLLSAYPGLAAVFTGGTLLLLVWLLSATSRGKYQVGGRSFVMWRTPETLIWALILGGFAQFFGDEAIKVVGLNLLTVLVPVYFLQGFAIACYYFRKKGIPPIFRSLGYALIFLLNPLPLVVTAVGVFDLWADFRKPRIKKT